MEIDMVDMQAEETQTGGEEALEYLQTEVKRLNTELQEFTAKLDQARGQGEQLAQRNAAIMGEVRRIETALDETPRLNIKEAYTEALSSQLNLLTIRGSMDKLHAQEAAARQAVAVVRKAVELLSKADEEEKGDTFNARQVLLSEMKAQEEERERLASKMHDGPAHSLTNFILQAEICQKLFDRDPEKAHDELLNLKNAAGDAFQRVREFIFDLRPMMLTDLGLEPTLKRYCQEFQKKTGIKVEENVPPQDRRLESYQEVLIFRGIQELMVNARDHGEADSVTVTLEVGDRLALATVENDGRGYGTGPLDPDAGGDDALGLRTLRERLELVGGQLRIGPGSGPGMSFTIEIPIGPAGQAAEVDAFD
jgi:two-component system sensor histidine kinase DegS